MVLKTNIYFILQFNVKLNVLFFQKFSINIIDISEYKEESGNK